MLQAQKLMFEAAKEQATLGLDQEKTESEIVLNYARSLGEIISAAGASVDQSMTIIERLNALGTEEGEDNAGNAGARAALTAITDTTTPNTQGDRAMAR